MPLELNGIVMWSGSINEIPVGWSLCDGNNGTPDLRNQFIVGSGDTYNFGSTGGFADAVLVTHNHTLSGSTTSNVMGNHTHPGPNTFSFQDGDVNRLLSVTSGSGIGTSASGAHAHALTFSVAGSGENGVGKNLPPYYSLAFIMQIE